jgi:hypothetical protein
MSLGAFWVSMAQALRIGPDHVELALEQPVRRGTATINVRWEDKEVFDAVQHWLSYQRSSSQSQWDVFSFLLSEALTNERSPLAEARLRLDAG